MDAYRDFNLINKREILGFVANGGLEHYRFQNTKVLKGTPILIDSYGFYSHVTFGYIAFFKGAMGKWNIKSLKKNDQPGYRNLVFADKLNRLSQKKSGGENG